MIICLSAAAVSDAFVGKPVLISEAARASAVLINLRLHLLKLYSSSLLFYRSTAMICAGFEAPFFDGVIYLSFDSSNSL